MQGTKSVTIAMGGTAGGPKPFPILGTDQKPQIKSTPEIMQKWREVRNWMDTESSDYKNNRVKGLLIVDSNPMLASYGGFIGLSLKRSLGFAAEIRKNSGVGEVNFEEKGQIASILRNISHVACSLADMDIGHAHLVNFLSAVDSTLVKILLAGKSQAIEEVALQIDSISSSYLNTVTGGGDQVNAYEKAMGLLGLTITKNPGFWPSIE